MPCYSAEIVEEVDDIENNEERGLYHDGYLLMGVSG
jgi:hypothetical protein